MMFATVVLIDLIFRQTAEKEDVQGRSPDLYAQSFPPKDGNNSITAGLLTHPSIRPSRYQPTTVAIFGRS
jgi:hypothetical protein